MYYIYHVAKQGWVGNFGQTVSDVDKANIYTEDEALEICKGIRGLDPKDIAAFPVSEKYIREYLGD